MRQKNRRPKSPTQQRSAAFCKFLAQDHHCQERSEEWIEVYIRFLEACKAYALHPQTPDSVAAAIIGGLERLRERLREEDWIPEELDA